LASNLRYSHPTVLRITTSSGETGTVLRIAGQLSNDGVQELERVCHHTEGLLILDLSELTKVDDSGLAALRELVARGAELAAVPPYIALLLERETIIGGTS
jgi:ABC-type transporter Mla MlaB component